MTRIELEPHEVPGKIRELLAKGSAIEEYEALFLVENGISPKSIAALIGWPLAKFQVLLAGGGEFATQYAAAEARYELNAVARKQEAVMEKDAPAALRYKAAHEDLKRLEHWAPASKPQVLRHDESKTPELAEPVYHEMSDEQLAAIRAKTESEDGNGQ